MSDKPPTLEEFLQAEEERALERSRQLLAKAPTAQEIAEVRAKILREQALEAIQSRDLKPQEAALVLGVHVNTLKRMLKSGVLTGYRIGTRGDWRITRDAIQVFKTRRTW